MVQRHRSALQRIATERHVGRMLAVIAAVGIGMVLIILLVVSFFA